MDGKLFIRRHLSIGSIVTGCDRREVIAGRDAGRGGRASPAGGRAGVLGRPPCPGDVTVSNRFDDRQVGHVKRLNDSGVLVRTQRLLSGHGIRVMGAGVGSLSHDGHRAQRRIPRAEFARQLIESSDSLEGWRCLELEVQLPPRLPAIAALAWLAARPRVVGGLVDDELYALVIGGDLGQ